MISKSLTSSFDYIQSKKVSSYNNNDLNNSNKNISKTDNNNNNCLEIGYKKTVEELNCFHKKISPQYTLEKNIYIQFIKNYSSNKDFYNIKKINEIITNEGSHIVAKFKDFLINEDYSEFLQRNYTLSESEKCLPKIFEYYNNCSVIFPNYFKLPESKYIYKNIQRKQRVIDNQQSLEFKLNKKNNLNNKSNDDNIVFFSIQVLDSILDQTDTSGIKDFFGVNINDDDSEKNNSMEIIINKISNFENNSIKLNTDRKNILKKKNDINKAKLEIKNNKNKGRNNNRDLNGGYNSLGNKGNKSNIFTRLNINNEMKKTKVCSNTIDVDSKNNTNNNNHNNIISIISNGQKYKWKNLPQIKKPKLIQSLFAKNKIECVTKIYKDMNNKKINKTKLNKRKMKSFSPVNTINNYNKLSPSSSKNKKSSLFNHRINNSKSRIENIYHKSTFNKNDKYLKKERNSKGKEISIPSTERDISNKNFCKSNNNNTLNLSKTNSISINSINNNIHKRNLSFNKKDNLKKSKINNIKKNFNRYGKKNNLNYKSPDCRLNTKNNFNFLTLSVENNIIIPTNNNNSGKENKKKNKKKTPNLIFPKKEMKGIKIEGFTNFQNLTSNSRKSSNSQRIIFTESLLKNKSKTNRNKINNIIDKA